MMRYLVQLPENQTIEYVNAMGGTHDVTDGVVLELPPDHPLIGSEHIVPVDEALTSGEK